MPRAWQEREELVEARGAEYKAGQGIKDYANWPTIPQLYINGEFIGGSDIMMEMYESGELQKTLGTAA